MRRILIASVMMVCAIALTGCKKGEGGAAGGGSGKSNHEKLQGTWQIDAEKSLEANAEMKAQADKNPEMAKGIKEMMSKMAITVTDKEMTMTGSPTGKDDKATYTVKSQEGNKITIESKDEGKDETETLTFEFKDDNTIVGTKQGGKNETMVLTRKK